MNLLTKKQQILNENTKICYNVGKFDDKYATDNQYYKVRDIAIIHGNIEGYGSGKQIYY